MRTRHQRSRVQPPRLSIEPLEFRELLSASPLSPGGNWESHSYDSEQSAQSCPPEQRYDEASEYGRIADTRDRVGRDDLDVRSHSHLIAGTNPPLGSNSAGQPGVRPPTVPLSDPLLQGGDVTQPRHPLRLNSFLSNPVNSVSQPTSLRVALRPGAPDISDSDGILVSDRATPVAAPVARAPLPRGSFANTLMVAGITGIGDVSPVLLYSARKERVLSTDPAVDSSIVIIPGRQAKPEISPVPALPGDDGMNLPVPKAEPLLFAPVPQSGGLIVEGLNLGLQALDSALKSLADPVIVAGGHTVGLLHWAAVTSWVLAAALAVIVAHRRLRPVVEFDVTGLDQESSRGDLL